MRAQTDIETATIWNVSNLCDLAILDADVSASPATCQIRR